MLAAVFDDVADPGPGVLGVVVASLASQATSRFVSRKGLLSQARTQRPRGPG
jgi:hypothetical protein